MTKPIDIYGIGNALVDTEYVVDDELLKNLNIQKGFMTLIDETQLHHLNEFLKDFPTQKACGGSAANTIIAASQQGATCFYSCKVADDHLGHFFIKDLTRHTVQTNMRLDCLEIGITGKCLVFITPDAERTMNTYLGISQSLDATCIDESTLIQSKYCYIEGYLAASPTGTIAAKKALSIAKQNGVKTALTFSDPAMVTYCNDALNDLLGDHVDLLFCNQQEALIHTQSSTLNDAIRHLEKKAETVVVTLGKDGCRIHHNGHAIHAHGIKTNAIDTNGAGDGFAGAFLAALCQGESLETAGKKANTLAAKIVAQYGPRLTDATITHA